jgi:hypothetical protein
MVLGPLREGGVDSGAGLPGAPARGDESLHQQRLGRDDAGSGGEGGRRFDGVDTLGEASGIAHVRRTDKGCERVARRARGTALRGGQRLRKAQTRAVSCS